MWHRTACKTSVSLLYELKFYRLPDATFYDCINTIYQFIKPFLDNNLTEMSIFEEYRAFKQSLLQP